ncbi:lipid-A-disaccharide synthase [Bacteroides caecigallinarum]|uniref:lipid-A-disaccharide synthase n=1 Tax=Bacteroides caecigallinarum TaxID=1411144 RepID=UPI00195800DF|nr:lipid-A-disaccharide synthase [Bacteroides caecigallinarum]MBM6863899.1 lipid-A-disaccharide synthase [Bacteroides caecigallinarum]
MKYYLIVGEASGDLHASNLMRSLKKYDENAEFRFFGGDLMQAVGGTLVKHYKDMAYMGFIPVLLHLRTIFRNMSLCKSDIVEWKPDVLILIDYPGFNLKIAKYIKQHTDIPVYYYISPKIWAWKEYRIKDIKRDIDKMFSILPFEIEFYKKHDYPICYVGNPSVDSVSAYLDANPYDRESFIKENGLSDKPIVAILAGSRKQEIKDNLKRMIEVARSFPDYQFVVAGAPGIANEYYRQYIDTDTNIIFSQTYRLLQHSVAAMVTSGTATLETALFGVPQVVCYYMAAGKLVSFLRKFLLKVKYISLVNLITGTETVRELVADEMSVSNLKHEFAAILPGGTKRDAILERYADLKLILGKPGASEKAAANIVSSLKSK